ncbi:MAG TPA: flagellar hook-basal body complex protein FliE [Solirubrobacteraceae bacterium]|jgi:flagellar hook-basal body complex protein FliE
MIIPPVSGLAGQLSSAAGTEGLTSGASAGQPAEGLTGVAGLEGAGTTSSTGGTPNFGDALTGAIESLETSQRSSDAASQALATGTVSDPEAAVTTVEDAGLEMQLAAQIRTKATEAVQTIFQTQI